MIKSCHSSVFIAISQNSIIINEAPYNAQCYLLNAQSLIYRFFFVIMREYV